MVGLFQSLNWLSIVILNFVLLSVSFPHYFLNATGRLADQLKTREWIVARITSITERVVDARVSDTHPS